MSKPSVYVRGRPFSRLGYAWRVKGGMIQYAIPGLLRPSRPSREAPACPEGGRTDGRKAGGPLV